VFAAAGVAKLADPQGTRSAVAGFGVPDGFGALVARALPLVELAVAVALLAPVTARWAALTAIVLLAVFAVAISLNLIRGRRPECHCFGQLHSAPVGWRTLIRNAALAVVGGAVLSTGDQLGPSDLGRVSLSAAEWYALTVSAVAVSAVALLGWFVSAVLRQQGRLLLRVAALEAAMGVAHSEGGPGLPVGTPAPDAPLRTVDGDHVTLDGLRQGRHQLVLFTDPHCGPCAQLLPEVGRWQRDLGDRLTVAIVTSGDVDEVRATAVEHGLASLVLQDGNDLASAYRSPGTPSAVVVDPEGRIASALGAGAAAVRRLAEEWGAGAGAAGDRGEGAEVGSATAR
jgi:hypothetical protein